MRSLMDKCRASLYYLLTLALLPPCVDLALADSMKKQKYETYQIDFSPFKKHRFEYRKYQQIMDQVGSYSLSQKEYQTLFNILKNVSNAEPQWIDGYWMVGSLAFQLGSSFDEDQLQQAKDIFKEGEDYSRACLKLSPKHPLCLNFVAANLGKQATIDGVLASLRVGEEVHRYWQEVLKSKYNYNFTPEVSLQGGVRYGLGLFYRLVPDFFLVEWLFDIRGNIQKSILYHKESIAIDASNPCAELMLSASLLCHAADNGSSEDFKEGMAILKKVQTEEHLDINQKICINDSTSLIDDPSKACGYTTAKQQDLDTKNIDTD